MRELQGAVQRAEWERQRNEANSKWQVEKRFRSIRTTPSPPVCVHLEGVGDSDYAEAGAEDGERRVANLVYVLAQTWPNLLQRGEDHRCHT